MKSTIAFAGGGTMGPVAPLLAVYKTLKSKDSELKFVWAGTADGPEREPINSHGIEFTALPTAKLARHLSLKWLTFIFDYLRAKKAANIFLDKYQPDIIVGVGGFTQVPLMRAAHQRGIICFAHQLDFQPTLSNLAVAKICQTITTSFIYHVKKFKKCQDVRHIATPNRFIGLNAPHQTTAKEYFGFDSSQPLVLFVGGGTGALAINVMLENNLDEWLKLTQVLQLTGKNRSQDPDQRQGYVRREFLDEKDMLQALCAADIVVSRAGMGAISDFAALSKAVILIPIPNSQQEKNTRHLPNASIEIKQGPDFFDRTYKQVAELIKNPQQAELLGDNLHKTIKTDNGNEIADIILDLISKRK